MSATTVRPGRPVRLELNAQRVTASFEFYRVLFGWTSHPLHVPPWGSIPLIANGTRVFGNQFMAMGAFATPRWLTWFSADLQHARERIKSLDGDVGRGIHQLGELGRLIDAHDPAGHPFGLIELQTEPPTQDQHGDPCLAEFWGSGAADLAPFYADILNLNHATTPTGAMVIDGETPRLLFRNTDFEIQPPRWIPYFRSSGVGGDIERARRAGAIVQVHQEKLPNVAELAILSDPGGCYFGLVELADG